MGHYVELKISDPALEAACRAFGIPDRVPASLKEVCVRPSHLPTPAKPGHGVHLNLSGHQF